MRARGDYHQPEKASKKAAAANECVARAILHSLLWRISLPRSGKSTAARLFFDTGGQGAVGDTTACPFISRAFHTALTDAPHALPQVACPSFARAGGKRQKHPTVHCARRRRHVDEREGASRYAWVGQLDVLGFVRGIHAAPLLAFGRREWGGRRCCCLVVVLLNVASCSSVGSARLCTNNRWRRAHV